MPRKAKEGGTFDQNAYIAEWGKENMAGISVRYKKEFVQQFKSACSTLGLKQSDVFRKAMQDVINRAEGQS